MDPITAIGVAASILQLSQAAFSLSTTLYSLGAAIASASDDIQALADDLKTFSQSLSILSRLLEDNKLRYSDDVYLMAAKIIKDCADLYVKIDKVLVKLSGNGKSNWKLRVKVAYKEAEIRKLMERLRDMKGTLATILMSLQVDLQLSLLKISSPSKIQRVSEKQLQPETIQILEEAQKTATQTCFLAMHPDHAEQTTSSTNNEFGDLNPRRDAASRVSSSGDIEMPPAYMAGALENTSNKTPQLFSRSLTEPIPRALQEAGSSSTRENEGTSPKPTFPTTNLIARHQTNSQAASARISTTQGNQSRSLKSVSSYDSYPSSPSVQESIDFTTLVEGIYNILHSFHTAFEVLESLIEKRLGKKGEDTYSAAKKLGESLTQGEDEIRELHNQHLKQHALQYTTGFTPAYTAGLRNINSTLLKDIVMALHMLSAKHVKIKASDFETLYACSEGCKHRAISIISEVAVQANKRNTGIHENKITAPVRHRPPETEDGEPSRRSKRHRVSRWLRGTSVDAKAPTTTMEDEATSKHDMFDLSAHESMTTIDEIISLEMTPTTSLQGPRQHRDKLKQSWANKTAAISAYMGSKFGTAMGYPFGHDSPTGHTDRLTEFRRGELDEVFELPDEEYRNIHLHHMRAQYNSPDTHRPTEPFRVRLGSIRRNAVISLDRLQSQDPFQMLWVEAYNNLSSSQAALSDALNNSLREKLEPLFSDTSNKLSEAVGTLVGTTAMKEHLEAPADLKYVIKHQNSILEVILTISSHLGLSRPVAGWSCVAVFLAIYEDIFETVGTSSKEISPAEIERMSNSFHQLEHIVGLLARYAVMENMYYKFPSLTLTVEYRAALLDLCVTILTYFAHAFMAATIFVKGPEGDQEKAIESSKICDELIETIKEKDTECRGFRVIVEVDEKSGTEIENLDITNDNEA